MTEKSESKRSPTRKSTIEKSTTERNAVRRSVTKRVHPEGAQLREFIQKERDWGVRPKEARLKKFVRKEHDWRKYDLRTSAIMIFCTPFIQNPNSEVG